MSLCHPPQLNARVQTTRPPRISITTFIPYTRHIYVPRPVQYRTSLCLASSSGVYRLVCDFCSSGREFASSFFQIPPHGGHPCSSLTVPAAKSVVDFHHQVVVHAAHTKKKPATMRSSWVTGIVWWSTLPRRNRQSLPLVRVKTHTTFARTGKVSLRRHTICLNSRKH